MAAEKIVKGRKTAAELRLHDMDTGSTEVQAANFTKRIDQINAHLQSNPKDHHSRRGLMVLVGKRSRLLGYLRNQDAERYRTLIGKLGLRK